MKIVVLNGSPKGKNSVTLQTVHYLEKHFPTDTFDIFHIGQQIRSFEKAEKMDKCVEALIQCQLIVFAYPVYTFMAPYQLHRFIELLKAHPRVQELENKCMTQITTSKHFYDVTAHQYIEENGADLGLRILPGLSADMDDLLTAKGRNEAVKFWKWVHFAYTQKTFEKKQVQTSKHTYTYEYAKKDEVIEKKEGYDTVIVTNAAEDDQSIHAMIEAFRDKYPYKTRVIKINEYPFSGGCLGCFNCATDGKCIYKDQFDTFLREKIQKADAIVYAATIKDHTLGASFKLYDDRQFCNGHRTVNMGMPIGYLLSGSYSKEFNLRQVVEGRSQVGHQFLAGVASDESEDAKEVEVAITRLSSTLAFALEEKTLLPQNFLGVGGMKIFRDLIYVMRGLMKEDHRFYKKHGIYDFPQKQIGTRLKMQSVGALMSIPSVRKKMRGKMNDAIMAPYKKVIDKY
ncbi:MAG: NAD(P)H-dependent oxidoreductase [Cellulosilyticaceae bacterium]